MITWLVKHKSSRLKYIYILLHKRWSFPLRFLQQMWPNPQQTADLVPFTKKILNANLNFFVQCLQNSQNSYQTLFFRKFIKEADLKPYFYDVQMEGGLDILKFFTFLQILLFLNNKSIVHFSIGGGG